MEPYNVTGVIKISGIIPKLFSLTLAIHCYSSRLIDGMLKDFRCKLGDYSPLWSYNGFTLLNWGVITAHDGFSVM